MLVLLAGGLGLLARSLKPQSAPNRSRRLAGQRAGRYWSCLPFACSLTQVSLSVSVRLKTGRPGRESGSAQK